MTSPTKKTIYQPTPYGLKKPGRTRFVIVAPHAGGDDLRTGRLAILVRRKLRGFAVINKKYFKAGNRKATQQPDYVEDFNRLSWSNKYQKYLWKRKNPAMKNFYYDILEYCDLARVNEVENKALVVYLHSFVDGNLGLDLGVGLKSKSQSLRLYGSSQSVVASGVPTVPLSQAKKLKNYLQEAFQKEYNLGVGMGRKFPAWSKRIAVQFHKQEGRNDLAIQLEVNGRLLADQDSMTRTVKLIAAALKQVFT